MDEDEYPGEEELVSRAPSIEDLMASACGIDYEEASQDQIIRLIDGVPIPFASPRMLYRMKVNTHREKDRADLLFLRENYPEVLLP